MLRRVALGSLEERKFLQEQHGVTFQQTVFIVAVSLQIHVSAV
jgi:hypothetical protein